MQDSAGADIAADCARRWALAQTQAQTQSQTQTQAQACTITDLNGDEWEHGRWWRRRFIGEYMPPISADNPSVHMFLTAHAMWPADELVQAPIQAQTQIREVQEEEEEEEEL